MVDPIGWPNTQQINVMPEHGSLQPIATEQQHFNGGRRLGCRITAENKQKYRNLDGFLRLSNQRELLFLNFVHQRLKDSLNLGGVLCGECRPEDGRQQRCKSRRNHTGMRLWRTNHADGIRQNGLLGGERPRQLVQQRFTGLNVCRRQTCVQNGFRLGRQTQGMLLFAARRIAGRPEQNVPFLLLLAGRTARVLLRVRIGRLRIGVAGATLIPGTIVTPICPTTVCGPPKKKRTQ